MDLVIVSMQMDCISSFLFVDYLISIVVFGSLIIGNTNYLKPFINFRIDANIWFRILAVQIKLDYKPEIST